MTFKEALKLLRQVENKARKLQAKIDSCHVQFDNMKEVINLQHQDEWRDYCHKKGLKHTYTFGDTIC